MLLLVSHLEASAGDSCSCSAWGLYISYLKTCFRTSMTAANSAPNKGPLWGAKYEREQRQKAEEKGQLHGRYCSLFLTWRHTKPDPMSHHLQRETPCRLKTSMGKV